MQSQTISAQSGLSLLPTRQLLVRLEDLCFHENGVPKFLMRPGSSNLIISLKLIGWVTKSWTNYVIQEYQYEPAIYVKLQIKRLSNSKNLKKDLFAQKAKSGVRALCFYQGRSLLPKSPSASEDQPLILILQNTKLTIYICKTEAQHIIIQFCETIQTSKDITPTFINTSNSSAKYFGQCR